MASSSLRSSCTVVPTNPNSTSRVSPSPKPSQLLMNGKRSHRFQVSCSTGGSGGGSSIDRRNMLLGLGGLYGASNLISADPEARADPLLPPEINKCDPQGATTRGNPLDVNCCPPFSDISNDYQLPAVKQLKVRRAAHLLTPDYIAKYELAIQKMRDLDVSDPDDPRGFTQQANIHCAYCNGPHDQVGQPAGLDIQVHNSWIFFPFHRWYLYFYERIMGELIGDPTFALPFWNWDNPKGMTIGIFDRPGPLYNENRDQTHHNPALVSLAVGSPITDPIQLISNNLAVMYNEMIGGVASATDFMGQPYRAGDSPPNSATGGTSERGSHGGIHVWTGNPDNTYREDMGNFYSAGRDPAFYSHHANVDRMWAVWSALDADYSKQITDPDFLNAGFMFYDEKKNLVRVKVADCLDHHKMGYKYDYVDTPWMGYRPPQKAVAANIQDLSKGVKSAKQIFPLTLNDTVKVLVKKTTKGKADEVLVLERIQTDNTKLIKFDVFINDEDDKPEELDRAEYAGTFTQLPHKVRAIESKSDLRLNLKELYENINIADDDTIVVTIVPHINGDAVTIGGIKIVKRLSLLNLLP